MFKPLFTITPAMLNKISRITEIKAVVDRSRVLPLNEAQLRRQAIARMAHTSTSIEGNPLAQFEVDKVLAGQKIKADERSIIEVKNYQQALQQISQLAQAGITLTIEEILSIHTTLMKGLLVEDKTGHFRPGPVYIVDDLGDKGEKLRFEGPEAKKVAFLIHQLLQWVQQSEQQELHPILLAGLFHSQFVHIHPFSDGNGRMTRLLTIFLLYKYNWDFRKILVLEDYYNRNRRAYYDSLAANWPVKYAEGVDFTPWNEYFVEGFLVEALKVMESIEMMGYAKVVDEGEQVYLDRDEIKIMDFLSTTGRLTSDDVRDVLGVAKRTAQLKVKGLLDKGLLAVHGKGPSTYYTLKN